MPDITCLQHAVATAPTWVDAPLTTWAGRRALPPARCYHVCPSPCLPAYHTMPPDRAADYRLVPVPSAGPFIYLTPSRVYHVAPWLPTFYHARRSVCVRAPCRATYTLRDYTAAPHHTVYATLPRITWTQHTRCLYRYLTCRVYVATAGGCYHRLVTLSIHAAPRFTRSTTVSSPRTYARMALPLRCAHARTRHARATRLYAR